MDLASFVSLLESEPAPTSVTVDWEAVESWLEVTLPSDYKQLATAYGPVDVGDFIWVQTPCTQLGGPGPQFEYAAWLEQTHRYVLINTQAPAETDLPVMHPAHGGLLAWGETRGGQYLLWDTGASTDPDEWPVVMFDLDEAAAERNPWRRYEMSVLEFLAAAVRQGLDLPRVGRRLGPLPARARSSAWLIDPQPWTPPVPHLVSAEQRLALTNGDGLDALRLLVPAPATPYLGAGSWNALFDELGVRLPTEYVELMETYGAGVWRHWLRTFIPLRPTFAAQITVVLEGYKELRQNHPGSFPLPVWPEPGGFLPFADSIEGDYVGWLTQGEPDNWPLVVDPRHSEAGGRLPHRLVDTLLEWSRGRLSCPGFPELNPGEDPLRLAVFEPATSDWPW